MKRCGVCKQEKNLLEFGVDKYKTDGLNNYCKACIKLRSAYQRRKNPKYYRNFSKRYREENRELLRKRAVISYYVNWEKRAEQARRSYEKHREKIARKRAKKNRKQEEREKNRLRQAEWRKSNRSKCGEVVANWKKKNPQKAGAHSLVLWAVKTGVLNRPDKCEECGKSGKIQGHHEDYTKPLEIKWLCKFCHSRKHQIYR
jgi:hypothetical protein